MVLNIIMTLEKSSLGLISIIIPAYNSGKFIETTLNNLFSQTYQNFEIIIAYDEKSTDGSLSLLQNISDIHPIIIDVGKDTSSGAARNRGLRLAKGEFVIFVDADDEILPTYLETLISIFNKHPELNVVCCDFVKVFENTIADGWRKATNSKDTYKLLSRDKALYMILWEDILPAPWLFLVRRQYLIDNNIYFPDYSLGDDTFYAHQLVSCSSYIGRSDKKLYIFILHPRSTTHSLTVDNWWLKYEKSRADIFAYFHEMDLEYAEDFISMKTREYVYVSVLNYNFSTFRLKMNQEGIDKLSMLNKCDRLPYQLSVICYSLSKKIFYHLARFVAGRMKDITPVVNVK